jgi:integrase
MSDNSTRKPRSRKAGQDRPKKPYPNFPLTVHASGKWQKRILGHTHYFGCWAKRVNGVLTRIEGDGWKEALELYKAQADDLHAGRTPRAKSDQLTLKALCNRFLTAKQQKREAGKLSSRMYERIGAENPKGEYPNTTDRLIKEFGGNRLVDDLTPDDFGALRSSLEKQFGPVRLGNEIQKVRTVFKFGTDNGLIQKTIPYGGMFRKPEKSELRKHRASRGNRLFDANELRTLIDGAGVQLKAMILLGINGGFGNTDCGRLPLSAVDLEGGWVTFPRPKTGIPRRCPLWPETVGALKAAIADRPDPKDKDAEALVFLTKYGRAWSKGGTAGAVSLQTGRLLDDLGIRRAGVGFYALRHTFRTIADATKDPNAIRLIMGHTDDSIDANYTHGIDDERLLKVTEYVRTWLFGKVPDDDSGTGEKDAPKKPARQTAVEKKNAEPGLRLYAPEGGAA